MEYEAVNVFFCSDEKFLYNTTVSIASIIKRTSPERKYNIFLIHQDISPELLRRVARVAEGAENAELIFINGRERISGIDFFIGNRRKEFCDATYYRLFAPWLLLEVSKAVYLDGDVIVRADIARLFDTDLGGRPIGASTDVLAFTDFDKARLHKRDYYTQVLGMETPEDYINSGVLIMDMDAIRGELTMEKMAETAKQYPWRCHDQDMINYLFKGRIKHIDYKWNCMVDPDDALERLAPSFANIILEAEKDPYIMHYAMPIKPWRSPKTINSELFWFEAEGTPFYREMIANMKTAKLNHLEVMTLAVRACEEGGAGMRFILRCVKKWAGYKRKKFLAKRRKTEAGRQLKRGRENEKEA